MRDPSSTNRLVFPGRARRERALRWRRRIVTFADLAWRRGIYRFVQLFDGGPIA